MINFCRKVDKINGNGRHAVEQRHANLCDDDDDIMMAGQNGNWFNNPQKIEIAVTAAV